MKSPRLLQRKPLLIPLLRNLLPGRDPVPSVLPPVKDLLGSGLPGSAPMASGPTVNGLPGSIPMVKDLPGNVLPASAPMVNGLPDNGLPASVLPAQLPQCTRRKKASIPHLSC